MRWTDRLNLPQKVVLVIALALGFGAIGDYIPTFATTTTRFGWYAYAPYQSTLSVHMGLPGWVGLIIWLVLIAAWTLLSVRILRPASQPTPRD